MYALFIAGDDDGNIPEWKENMEKYDAEITALGERIYTLTMISASVRFS